MNKKSKNWNSTAVFDSEVFPKWQQFVRSNYPLGQKRYPVVKETIKSIWEAYTSETVLPFKVINEAHQTHAYLEAFHLNNAWRTLQLLEKIDARIPLGSLFNQFPNLFVLDQGCGTGALTQALMGYLNEQYQGNTILKLVDQSKSALMAAEELNKNPDKLKIFKNRANLFDVKLPVPREETLYMFTFGYVLNELLSRAQSQSDLLGRLKPYSDTSCVIFILDTAQQSVSRPLMGFRDALVDQGFFPLYPCPNFSTSCPQLLHKKDWCFSVKNHPTPKNLERQNSKWGRRNLHQNFSGYFFATKPVIECINYQPKDQKVAVSDIIHDTHNKPFVLTCNGNEVERTFGKFNQTRRGDLC